MIRDGLLSTRDRSGLEHCDLLFVMVMARASCTDWPFRRIIVLRQSACSSCLRTPVTGR
jgi:hypothetical protein